MKTLLLLFPAGILGILLMSSRTELVERYHPLMCSNLKFPTGGPGPFRTCSPLLTEADILCSGCHGQNPVTDGNGNILDYGNIVDGSIENSFKILSGSQEITEYTPGQDYIIELSMNSMPIRKGFDAVICSSTGDNGLFEALTIDPGVQVTNDPGYMYATHTSNTGTDVWRWKWTAPSADPGTISFHILTLKDNLPVSSADSLFISEFQIGPVAAQVNEQVLLEKGVQVWIDQHSGEMMVLLNENIDQLLTIELLSNTGKQLLRTVVDASSDKKHTIDLPEGRASGIYFARIITENKKMIHRKLFIGEVN